MKRFTPVHWLLGTTAGLTLWASSFVVLYGVLSLGCAYGWHVRAQPGGNLLTLALVAAWLAHLAALAVLWHWFGRWPREGLLRGLSRTLTVVALACTVWTGWPVLVLPPCAGQELALLTEENVACSKT